MQAGYQFAARKHYQCAIQVDGDGQHPTKEISTLLEVVRSGRADLVVGSRYVDVGRLKGRVSSLSRVFGGTILCYWLAVLSGKSIKDPTSGFRAMNRGVFTLFAREYPSDYPEPISLLMLLRRSFSICEVGVKMNERTQGTSSIRSLHSVLYMLKVIWRMTLERVFR